MFNLLFQKFNSSPSYRLYKGPKAPQGPKAGAQSFEMFAPYVDADIEGQPQDIPPSGCSKPVSLLDVDIPSDVAAALAPVGSLDTGGPQQSSIAQYDFQSTNLPLRGRRKCTSAIVSKNREFGLFLSTLPADPWGSTADTRPQGVQQAGSFDALGVASLPRSATYDKRGFAVPDSTVGYYPWMTAGSPLEAQMANEFGHGSDDAIEEHRSNGSEGSVAALLPHSRPVVQALSAEQRKPLGSAARD